MELLRILNDVTYGKVLLRTMPTTKYELLLLLLLLLLLY